MLDVADKNTQFYTSLALCGLYLFLFSLLLLCCYLAKANKPWLEFRDRNVLLITAHPDDECMFFGPVIADALRSSLSVSLLCLTKGNFYGQGDTRKQELLKSCRLLGVKNVTTIDNKKIQDDPKVDWNVSLVGDVIFKHIQNYKVDSIITFDEYGVSGHRNHASTYKAMQYLIDQKCMPQSIPVYTLNSVNLLRKYMFVFDVLWSYFTTRLVFVSNLTTVINTQYAMAAHKSQYVWYRRLYIFFSRYMIVNTLTQISGHPTREKSN